MTQISEGTGFELIRRLVKGAADYHADLIVTVCPMCQLNLDAFQGAMNRYFKTAYHVPVLYFTQMMGLAFGQSAAALGIGAELVDARPALAKIGVEVPPPPEAEGAPKRKRDDKSLPMPKMPKQRGCGGAGGEAMKHSDEARVGVYVCHCGSNIAATVDVENVAQWAGENLPNVVVRARQQVHVLQPRPGVDREGHQGAGPDACRRGRLLAAPPRGNLPRRVPARGAEPVPVRHGLDPGAGLLGDLGPRRRHREGQGADLRRRASRHPQRAVGADPGRHQPERAGGRRRHRGHPGCAGDRRQRQPRLPGGARAVAGRAHGPVRQDFPHPGLLRLHPDAQDVQRRQPQEHHAVDLQRGRKGRRLHRQLHGEDPPAGAQGGDRAVHRLRRSARRSARRRSSTTYSRPVWATARRSTARSRRPSRSTR